jgi:ATP-dependent RNA helicase RhlE
MIATTSFPSLRLSAPLLKAIQEQSYTIPTDIQQQAIPPALDGKDILGCAQTGTGKTAAFALPILQRLDHAPSGCRPQVVHPRALILSPTRELAAQIVTSFAEYGRHTSLRYTAIYGGVSQGQQVRALRAGVDVLVATPGRLLDLLEQRLVSLESVQILVLDEADRLLDMGFIDPIRRIASCTPRERQTMLFSATMPRQIIQLAASLLRNPVEIHAARTASNTPKIHQTVCMLTRPQKQQMLEHMLSQESLTSAIVFMKTKRTADRMCKYLRNLGVSADAIHGNKQQGQRDRAWARFKGGQTRVLVATDVAARGLDMDDISHVINYDLPNDPEAYVHRIGRTGRAGSTGTAVAFCDPSEVHQLRDIERLLGKRIDRHPVPQTFDAMHVQPHPARGPEGHAARPHSDATDSMNPLAHNTRSGHWQVQRSSQGGHRSVDPRPASSPWSGDGRPRTGGPFRHGAARNRRRHRAF